MKKYRNILVAALIFGIILSGCSSDDENSQSPVLVSTVIKANEPAREIKTENEVKILYGGGAMQTYIFDEYGEVVSATESIRSVYIPAGIYAISARDSTNNWSDGEGIIFFPEGNFNVEILHLNETIVIRKRTAKIYQFEIENDTNLIVSASRLYLYLYDENLEFIKAFGGTGTVSLESGKYYLAVDTNTFILDGTFSLSSIGTNDELIIKPLNIENNITQ